MFYHFFIISLKKSLDFLCLVLNLAYSLHPFILSLGSGHGGIRTETQTSLSPAKPRLLLGNPMRSQAIRNIFHPGCSGFALCSFQLDVWPGGNLIRYPVEPSQLTDLDAEKHRLYSELPPEIRAQFAQPPSKLYGSHFNSMGFHGELCYVVKKHQNHSKDALLHSTHTHTTPNPNPTHTGSQVVCLVRTNSFNTVWKKIFLHLNCWNHIFVSGM